MDKQTRRRKHCLPQFQTEGADPVRWIRTVHASHPPSSGERSQTAPRKAGRQANAAAGPCNCSTFIIRPRLIYVSHRTQREWWFMVRGLVGGVIPAWGCLVECLLSHPRKGVPVGFTFRLSLAPFMRALLSPSASSAKIWCTKSEYVRGGRKRWGGLSSECPSLRGGRGSSSEGGPCRTRENMDIDM